MDKHQEDKQQEGKRYVYYMQSYFMSFIYDISKYAHLLLWRMEHYTTKTVLPSSSTPTSRETHKKYMEGIANMKKVIKSPTWISLKDVACEDNTTKLLQQPQFRSTKYIFEYMKAGFKHVQIVLDEEDNSMDDSKEL